MASDTVVGNGTKRLHNGSIHAVFPLFCPRNPSSLITGRFFLENDGRWLAEKRHVIRDDGLRRVIITGFTVSWSVSIVSDAVSLNLGRSPSVSPAAKRKPTCAIRKSIVNSWVQTKCPPCPDQATQSFASSLTLEAFAYAWISSGKDSTAFTSHNQLTTG